MSDHEDLPTFLLWVAESYEALAKVSTIPDEIDGFNGSAKMARRHRAALVSPPTKAGAGEADWVLVPREPVPEMLAAWYRYKSGHHWPDEPPPADTSDYGAYRAMIAARPTQQPRGDGVRVPTAEQIADELVAHGEFSSIPSNNHRNAVKAAEAVLKLIVHALAKGDGE